MIITSLLDTDLYKFTMMQVVLHQFPGAQVEYRFKCRNPGVQLAPYVNEIRAEIRSLCSLRFQDAELAYLSSLRFIKSDFVDFLGLFQLNEKYITVQALPGGEIDITIRGPWLHTILFEIPVLAIVNEVYFRNTQPVPDFPEGRRRLDTKIALLQQPGLEQLKIADYGTRRRFSRAWHEEVLRVLCARLGRPGASVESEGQFAGTSNVLYAMKLGVRPLGTLAHEYLQACQSLGPRTAGTWALRCRTSTACRPSCAISTSTSASSSTERAMTAAIPSSGASACWPTTAPTASIRGPRR
jgi:nicotinate phosphoribosyltransferase